MCPGGIAETDTTVHPPARHICDAPCRAPLSYAPALPSATQGVRLNRRVFPHPSPHVSTQSRHAQHKAF